jgi:hypothetical protein
MRTLRKLSSGGDTEVARWDPKTVTPARLAEIEAEFEALQKKGYFAVNITGGNDTMVHEFDANADLLMIPRVQGGVR